MNNLTQGNFAVVSAESEELILVNDADEEVGFSDKSTCHNGDGILHRAFSLLIFNGRNELLLQQRSAEKRLWGGYWSNSCCSHPRRGETMEEATVRRLQQELGLDCALQFLYKFQYAAPYGDSGSERELCWVYFGKSDQPPVVNQNEVSAWRYISMENLALELSSNPDVFTPWFKQEWQEISANYKNLIIEGVC